MFEIISNISLMVQRFDITYSEIKVCGIKYKIDSLYDIGLILYIFAGQIKVIISIKNINNTALSNSWGEFEGWGDAARWLE